MQELTERFSSQMVSETRLVESCEAMKEKIAILALIELLFAAQATHRTVPFNTIAQATRVPPNSVRSPFSVVQNYISSIIVWLSAYIRLLPDPCLVHCRLSCW